ncbi:SDR family NAD(P)-dependent oxidoreductase [Streptomyces sp. PSRA5]|uniref:SDR family NAD(P)-dependent oxidoreductase n=1 Tax=Streptomyces panacea TaxID=3035064 RepID=UPI00339C1EE3
MDSSDTPVALVTGGTSGIGLATARLLSERGYAIAVCGRDQQRLDRAARELPLVHAVRADLASREAAAATVAEVVSTFGRLDVLVNAHGVVGKPGPVADLPAAEWDHVLGTNLMGSIATTVAAVPALRRTRGAVVHVASISAIQAAPQTAPYGVSKAGLVAFTKHAAADLAQFGIRVNAVLPGWVRTPPAIAYFEEIGLPEGPTDGNFLRRVAEPVEIAEVIAFLASPKASFITGEAVVADGGEWIKMADLESG